MNYVQYEVLVNRFPLEKYKFEYDYEKVKFVEMVWNGESCLNATFYLSDDVNDEEEAKSLTNDLLKDIMNLISYRFNLNYNAYLVAFYRNGKRIVYGRAVMRSFATLQVIGDYTEELSEGLRNNELLKELRYNPYHHLFRGIISIQDVISKYLLLYSLISLIKEDNQNKIDQFIATYEPNGEKMSRIRTSGKEETKSVYTTLRNKVGHITTNEDIRSITQDMNRTMDGLIRLTKIVIKQTYSTNREFRSE